jgi:cytochrome c peroxidase
VWRIPAQSWGGRRAREPRSVARGGERALRQGSPGSADRHSRAVRRVTLVAALVALAGGCDDTLLRPVEPPLPPRPPLPPPLTLDQQLRELLQQVNARVPPPPPRPSPALVGLGQALYFDKILSGNRDVSCATCHDPLTHTGDALSLSVGTGGTGVGAERAPGANRQFLPRHSPDLFNRGAGLVFTLFWDGRVSQGGPSVFNTPAGAALPAGLTSLLAAQAMLPVTVREEMRGQAGDLDRVGEPNELARLRDDQVVEIWQATMRRVLAVREYVQRFNAAFPGTPTSELGFQHAANAIAAFEVEAFTKLDSPVDRFILGDNAALSEDAKQGALLFFGKGRCASCHIGPLLTNQSFANVGVPQLGPGKGAGAPLDFGLAELIGNAAARFHFRVAPLRNVELTAPYMHNGAYATLEAVVRHYNDVPTALRRYDVSQLHPLLRTTHHGDSATIAAQLATLDPRLRQPLGLTDPEIRQLVAFLEALTDPSARDMSAVVPAAVPSGLPVRE